MREKRSNIKENSEKIKRSTEIVLYSVLYFILVFFVL